jgi:hypothetical protein
MNAMTSHTEDLPSDADVDVALKTAATLCREDIRDIKFGRPSDARHYAFRALILAFPDLNHGHAAKLVGALWPAKFQSDNAGAELNNWWSDKTLDAVLTAVANAPRPPEAA